ncbi:MAG: ATP-binding cassette domain-containing protein [Bacteroidetes bacterium]|nr:ATP-binding cassette domain-containing protein [Bacteroidota bacterium]
MKPLTFSADISVGSHSILSITDFSIEQGKINVLFGESGIGKTLISKSIFGLTDPDKLSIEINSLGYQDYLKTEQVEAFRKNGFFVLQEPSSQFNPSLTIQEQLNEADLNSDLTEADILSGLWQSDQWKSLLPLYPQSFRPSGGEKQRFLLAMALKKMDNLANQNQLKPETLFIFDEPSGSLDNGFRNAFLEQLISRYQQNRFTVLVITHDYTIIPWFKNHKSELTSNLSWLELTKTDSGELQCNPFFPDEFISWQKKLSPMGLIKGVAVADLNSGVICHGRQLSFQSGTKPIESLKLKSGTLTYLKAPSGVGKTTVARLLLGLYHGENLQLSICGYEFTSLNTQVDWKKLIWGKKAGMAFQLADEALNPVSTVKQVFTALKNPKLKTNDQILDFLQPVFLKKLDEAFLSGQVKYLSGGQKQRLNLMRSIASEPEVLILDEPLNGVDFRTIKMFTGILEKLLQNGTAILLISHNEEIFDKLSFKENQIQLKADELLKENAFTTEETES